MSTPVDDFEIIHALSQAFNVKYTTVSAVFLLFYDTAIGFSDEIKLIWLQRWSFGKVLYIIARYGCFIDVAIALLYNFSPALSPKTCRVVYQFGSWILTIGVNICQVVFLIRTNAIWGQNTCILAYLCVIQMVSIVVCLILLMQSNETVTFGLSVFPTIVPCIPTLGNNRLFIDFCVVSIVELNFLSALLVRGLSQWRRVSSPLIHTLYRDGIVYFVVLFLICLINATFLLKEFNSPYFYIASEHQRVFHSIFASRVIINVRKAFSVTEVVSGKTGESFCDWLSESINFATGISVDSEHAIEDSEQRGDDSLWSPAV